MTSTASPIAGELQSFRQLATMTSSVLHANVAGVSHEESLIRPPAGNCLNWIVGHLVNIYNLALPLFGQQPVADQASLAVYDRGAPPLTDPARATPLGELLALWDEAAARVEAGLAAFPAETLDQPAPFSPGNDPDETFRSLISTIIFHQAYHAGQTGVLRRIAGHEGTIK
jgi:DinB superfamily